ncbi:MAG TPA: S49 family peptidase [Thermomicrobiales bacterium]|nr:S49 family peptidase [Thermomicrobiales bacterium]
MPYSPDDKNLPPNVKKMPLSDRTKWCNTWNGVYDNCTKQGGSTKTCERRAFKLANGTFTAHPKRTKKDPAKKPAARAFHAACNSAWAITEEMLATILDVARRDNPDPVAVALELGRPLAGARRAEARGPVAVLPVDGPIFRHANLFSELSGGTSVESLALDLTTALRDPAIGAICVAVDSPGGEVNGVHELAAAIRAASAVKPTVAYISHLGASAAYWLAAACPEVVCDATAQVGNIGVIATLRGDAPPKDGEAKRYTFVSSQSPKKRPDPESDEGRALLQANVDALANVFLAQVADFRGVDAAEASDRFGQGAVFVGADAVAAGLCDRLGSFEGVIADLTARVAQPGLATPLDPQPRPLRPVPQPAREAAAAAHADNRQVVRAILRQYGVSADAPAGGGEAIQIDGQGLDPVAVTTFGQGLDPVAVTTFGHGALANGALANGNLDIAPTPSATTGGIVIGSTSTPTFAPAIAPVPSPNPPASPSPDLAAALEAARIAAYRSATHGRGADAAAPTAPGRPPAIDAAPGTRQRRVRTEGAAMEPTSVLEQALAALAEQGQDDLADALRDAAAAQDAELAEARERERAAAAMQGALEHQVNSLESSVKAIQADSRRERFKAEVLGLTTDGLRWPGEVEANVGMLETMADAFGEDSEQFASYREQQRRHAALLRESVALQELGSAGRGKRPEAPRRAEGRRGPEIPTTPVQERVNAAVEQLRAAQPTLSFAAAVGRVLKADPQLKDAYYAEMGVGRGFNNAAGGR